MRFFQTESDFDAEDCHRLSRFVVAERRWSGMWDLREARSRKGEGRECV